ncbi:transferrin-binding protein-like solute binding protein [Sphingomonas sp. LB-2]|uniref:transferrin-binding protein-like solute binding protein n=1 Tax=Sphingomonas caeni TaxID=2984949 RepID=UPI00222F2692|nr:transferrin-binding protein-like solute binding protein [Sphingomonas caeni]MCW3848937.1 transferrin-binding protein-like solute binding protein [Sphingomonas caeni]
MIRRSFVFKGAALSLAMALAACSGSDPSPTPSPTPTPTPTTTPTPTPVSYSSFPLTAATEFGSINAYTSYTGDPSGAGTLVLGPSGVEGPSTRFRLAVLVDPTTASTTGSQQVVRENVEESRFVNADLTAGTPPATGVTEFAFVQNGTTAGQTSRAEFLNNTVKDKVTTDAGLALTRTSYTGWLRADSTAGAHRITYGAWGYPTVGTDMPTTGSATYTARVAGRAVTGGAGGTVVRLGGTVAVTVNWATGGVTFTANVTTVAAGGAETPFGTYTGVGSIAAGATTFTGNFGAGSPIPGSLLGAFFGPQGSELGITFSGAGTIGGTDTRIVGAIVGKKN